MKRTPLVYTAGRFWTLICSVWPLVIGIGMRGPAFIVASWKSQKRRLACRTGRKMVITTAWIAFFPRHFRVIFSFFIYLFFYFFYFLFFYWDRQSAFAERGSGQHTEERTWRFWMQFWVFVRYAVWTIWTCFFLFSFVQGSNRTRPRAPVQNQQAKELLRARKTQKYVKTQQQRPESPTVILIWHAIKYKTRKLNYRYLLIGDHYRRRLRSL